ncbi:MAG: hypothetical protein L0F96_02495 [Lactococcus lactis]|nr:hypothetical protein [Lactococcus lactis]MDN5446568.1 hypothetical protein [Lactococcus lactis]MDN5473930.1 hypothetical protein [Lactococcus lactis]
MKKYKFVFWNGKNEESEIFELDENLTEEEIDKVFKEWYFNQLDMAGIEGTWDEQK